MIAKGKRLAPAERVQVRILPGLPGGEPYVSREELEAFADQRIRDELEAIRGLTLAGFICEWEASKYGGVR